MFARVAPRYDLANRVLSLGLDRGWRRRMVREVAKHSPRRVLDLATGSGDVAFALAAGLPDGTGIVGMDFCGPMLDQARDRQRAMPAGAARSIRFEEGDALALPLAEASVDAVTISFGLRNTEDRARALAEMRRVLRPGGHLHVLEFSQPHRWFRGVYFWYLRWIAPRIAGLLTGQPDAYDYLAESIAAFPDHAGLAAELRRAGFEDVRALRMTFGTVALHSGRR